MFRLVLTSIAFMIMAPLQSIAAAKWANCPGFHGTSVQEVFWKSDVNGGSGPDYHLKSGQVLRNAGSVCQPGSVLKPEEWATQLKTELNPVRAVKSFRIVKSPEEFQKFLNEIGVNVDDQVQLNEAVQAFLAGQPIEGNVQGSVVSAPNSAILVGKSGQQALIALVMSDGKSRSATFMSFNK